MARDGFYACFEERIEVLAAPNFRVDAQHRLRAALTEEDPAVVSQKALQAVQTIDSSQWVAREA